MTYLYCTFSLFLFCGLTALQAQHTAATDLERELLRMDSLLFEEGFNRCNLHITEQIVHPDLEFLHDQGGRQDRQAFFAAVRQNICSGSGPKPIRQLEPGSLQNFPLYDNGRLYGAVQTGIHHFYLRRPDQPLYHTSTARFTHTWLLSDEGNWQLYRVLSYDHQSPE